MNSILLSKLHLELSRNQEKLDKLKGEKDLLDLELSTLERSISLAKLCIEESSKNRQLIEEGVTDALQYIFEMPFNFKFINQYLDGELKGIRIVIELDGLEHTDIEEGLGSGVATITDFLLNLFTILVQNRTRKLIVGDEPFSALHERIWIRLGEWLENICEETDLQIILLTHHQTIFGKAYKIEKINGESIATEI